MWFWWFLFVCNLMIPMVLIIHGKRKSENKYCRNIWWKLGWSLFFFSVAAQLPVYHCSMEWVGITGIVVCAVQGTILMGSILPVERAVRKRVCI